MAFDEFRSGNIENNFLSLSKSFQLKDHGRDNRPDLTQYQYEVAVLILLKSYVIDDVQSKNADLLML